MNDSKNTTPQRPGQQPAKLIKLTNIASVESLGKALTDEWTKIKIDSAHATDELKIKAFNEAVFNQANKIYAVLDLDLEINTNIVNTEIKTTRDKLEAKPDLNSLLKQSPDDREKALLESLANVKLEAENFKKAVADLITNSEEIAKGLLNIDQNPKVDVLDSNKIFKSIVYIVAAAALVIGAIVIGQNILLSLNEIRPRAAILLALPAAFMVVGMEAPLLFILAGCLASMSLSEYNNRIVKAPLDEKLDFLNGKLENLNLAHDTLQEIVAKPIVEKDTIAK